MTPHAGLARLTAAELAAWEEAGALLMVEMDAQVILLGDGVDIVRALVPVHDGLDRVEERWTRPAHSAYPYPRRALTTFGRGTVAPPAPDTIHRPSDAGQRCDVPPEDRPEARLAAAERRAAWAEHQLQVSRAQIADLERQVRLARADAVGAAAPVYSYNAADAQRRADPNHDYDNWR